MTVTTTGLTKAAGLSAAAAGLIFIAVQINHPAMSRRLGRHHRVGGAQLGQGRHGGARSRRHHRDVPPPGPPDRRRSGSSATSCSASATCSCSPPRSSRPTSSPASSRLAPGYVNDVVVAAAGGTPVGDIGVDEGRARRRGCRLHARWARLRRLPLPGRDPRPLGVGPPRRRHHRDRLARVPARVVQPPDGRPGRSRPRRSRCLAVARAEHRAPSTSRPSRTLEHATV